MEEFGFDRNSNRSLNTHNQNENIYHHVKVCSKQFWICSNLKQLTNPTKVLE